MGRAILLALSLSLAATPAVAASISGAAKVIDGDTLEVNGHRIRLFGIDAPEATQKCDQGARRWACGDASSQHLRSLIGNYAVTCSGNELDQYGRLVAVCTVAGVDVNKVMVADGWATAFRRYSEAYVADEARARAGKLGLWSSEFMLPEDYRRLEREGSAGPSNPRRTAPQRPQLSTSASGCVIKGNRNRRGEWIYHLPGMPYYEQTRAEEMFCTEAQAQAAGYRRAKVR